MGIRMTLKDTLKHEIQLKDVLGYFGLQLNSDSKTLCPFHADTDASLLVNHSYAYCFGCGWGGDMYDFIIDILDSHKPLRKGLIKKEDVDLEYKLFWNEEQKRIILDEGLALGEVFFGVRDYRYSFPQSVLWIQEHKGQFPHAVGEPYQKFKYLGSVHPLFVDHWHKVLPEARRIQLRHERLLTDETINKYQLGWRPDKASFSIPFWSEVPGQGEVEIVQFRSTYESPEEVRKKKFYGLTGHYKACWMNKHFLSSSWLVIVFGTFDAILGAQDGFPMLSPNGVTTYTSKAKQEELNQMFAGKSLYIVPDNTPAEMTSVHKMMNLITEAKEMKVCYFPSEVKDYGEYRKIHSPLEFYSDVLGWSIS
jgi:hypothetical protein